MLRRNADLLLVSSLAGLSAIAIEIIESVGVRVIFAVPLLLVLPGYALGAATFARHRLGRAHVVLLSLGLSLASVVIGSGLLDLTIHLRSGAWIALQLCIVW